MNIIQKINCGDLFVINSIRLGSILGLLWEQETVVLTVCVVQKIREGYPEPNGKYVGFKNSKKLPA